MPKLPPRDLCSTLGKINSGIVIVVDDTTCSYKIVFINDFNKKHPSSSMSHPVANGEAGAIRQHHASRQVQQSSTKVEGLVYTRFSLGREKGHAIAAYNIQEDKWDELHVACLGLSESHKLVVVHHLFMIVHKKKLTPHLLKEVKFELWAGYEEDPYTEGFEAQYIE